MKMKVICINKVFFREFHIEVGETIEVDKTDTLRVHPTGSLENTYVFYKDGETYCADKAHFITIEEWREKQINKILL